jgi:acetyl-CoA carboxylase carboxyltransferase component
MNENLCRIAVAINLLRLSRKLMEDATNEMGRSTSPDVSTETYRRLTSSVYSASREISDRIKDLKLTRDEIAQAESIKMRERSGTE